MNSAEAPQRSWQFGTGHDRFVDPLLDSLVLLSRYYGNPCSEDSLTSGLPLVDNRLSVELFPRAAERAGLSARLAKHGLSEIPVQLLPCLLLLKDQRCCLLLEVDRQQQRARVLQPEARGGEDWLPLEQLESDFSGYLFYVKRRYRFDERSPEVLETGRGHWFWSALREGFPVYRDVFLASLLINLFAAASPLFVMNVYDRVVPNLAFESLWVLAAGVAVVFVFDFALRQLRSYFIDLAGKKIDLQVSARIFSRVLGMRMEARPLSVGAFANNLQSFENVREFLTSVTIGALVDLPFALLILLLIWVVAGPLAAVPMLAMVILLVYSLFVQRPLAAAIEQTAQHAAQKNALLVESLSGLETLKITGAQSRVQSQWERAVAEIGQQQIQTRKISNAVTALSAYLQQMVTVSTVVFGVYRVADGELSMGGIIAAVMLGSRAVAPMAQIALLSTRFNQARSSMRLMEQLMAMPEEQAPEQKYLHRPQLLGKVEFEQLSFHYPQQQQQALSSINLSIEAGEKVAIIGRIGAGKSTVGRLLLGLYRPVAGAIRVDGVNLEQIHPADLRRNIGCVTQDNPLFYGSIRENIILGAPYTDDAAILRAVEFSGVNSFTDIDPQGLERQVGEGGRFLSGGQRQAVAIARAMLMDPPLLVFDEPTSQLDSRAEQGLLKRLKNLDEKRTLLLITHKTSMLEAVDRLIVLDRGRLVADGPKEQVLKLLQQGKVRAGGGTGGAESD